jgi:hypothetical protein
MTNENIYYVYQYLDPSTKIPFYVGFGKNKRAWDHIKEAIRYPIPEKGTHKLNKIRKLLSENTKPIIEIVDSNLSKDEACKLEIELIKAYGRIIDNTGSLTNIAPGGLGGDTLTFSQNKDQRIKNMSKVMTNKVNVKDENGKIFRVSVDEQHNYIPMNLGSKRTYESKQKMRKSQKLIHANKNVTYVCRISDRKEMKLSYFMRWINNQNGRKETSKKIFCSRISDRKVISANHLNREPTP